MGVMSRLGDAVPSLDPGTRVALQIPGSIAYVELVLGLLSHGIFPIPLDPKLTSFETDELFAELAPTARITAAADLAQWQMRYPVIGLPRGRPIHVTSGTTGRPKGVWSGLLSAHHAEALVSEERELWGFASGDVNLVLSPLHHSAPLRFAMGTLLAGGRLVVPGPFDVERITAAIHNQRPTSMFCVPTHLQRLFAHWDQTEWPDLTSFRLVAHAGAPCPDPVKQRLLSEFPPGSTWEFYGSTEGQFTACRSEEWAMHPGTVGRARPGRRLWVEPDGHLWCEVPGHARFSYFGDPVKTEAAWRGSSFTVGDLGRIDEDGYVYLDGRRVDLIITGGVNVYPAEVENVLSHLDGIVEIAVYGVPDPNWGMRVCAAYVGDVAEQAIRDYARAHLAPAKRPKTYLRSSGLPRTATGKVLRRSLSEQPH